MESAISHGSDRRSGSKRLLLTATSLGFCRSPTRRNDRQRCPPADRCIVRRQRCWPSMGSKRLHARIRRFDSHGWCVWRPLRRTPGIHCPFRTFHRSFSRVWTCAHFGDSDSCQGYSRYRGGHSCALFTGGSQSCFQRGSGTGESSEHLGGGSERCTFGRASGWRPHHSRYWLAQYILH
jgi:hypothetical protein